MNEFVAQIFCGKTIGRILFNKEVALHCGSLSGKVLDLASGGRSSYTKYLPKDIDIITTDSLMKDGVSASVDFNESLPFPAGEFDAVLFFNALYIAENRISTLQEIARVLKKDGVLYLSSPFLYAEIPEPVDYCRLTAEGLEKELREAGFSRAKIVRFGERFTAAANLLHPFFVFNVVRFVAYGLAIFLDKMIPAKIKHQHPAPLGYFCVAQKNLV